jgi:hypothetical protein
VPITAAIRGEYVYPGASSYDGVGVLGLAVQTPNSYGIGGVFLGGYYGIYTSTRNIGGGYGVYALADSAAYAAVYAVAQGTTQYGIYAIAPSPEYAGYFNGNLHYTGTLSSASDARLKENVADYSGALAHVMQLSPKTYNFKTDEIQGMNLAAGKQFGFIAQELQQVYPELVHDAVNRVENPKDRSDRSLDLHYKSVDYMSLIPVLTKAIQEQQQTIEQMQKEIDQLKNK